MYTLQSFFPLFLLVPAFVSVLITLKTQRRMSREEKLELSDKTRKSRITAYIFFLCFIILVCIQAWMFWVSGKYFFICIYGLLILAFILLTAKNYKKLKSKNVPAIFLKAVLVSRLLTLLIFVFAMAYSFYTFTLQKNAYDSWYFMNRADHELNAKNYRQAIADYNKGIEADSSNERLFINRGTAKYYSGDQAGACADWEKSARMGDSVAKWYMTDYCK